MTLKERVGKQRIRAIYRVLAAVVLIPTQLMLVPLALAFVGTVLYALISIPSKLLLNRDVKWLHEVTLGLYYWEFYLIKFIAFGSNSFPWFAPPWYVPEGVDWDSVVQQNQSGY